ncbi:MAG: tripartite tricarboxylate transporter substrate binding protein [Proteobacteria bacterium]|jgi:tripartite-type tricarboxylate transporter receptor subunit TctC|nr:tripartite tricarboxylate transporter substrate binding protein [Ramlibacter sp.]MCA0213858.1 tripartite tricarboxylate transporter substrate binding protein [Pseudomonadota bacterium]
MKNLLNRRAVACLGAAAVAAAGLLPLSSALAQAWPTGKAITLVVGYPPGGSTDMVARTVGDALSKRLGTPVIIENIGGAGGSIGAQKVANAAPDGYTLLLAANNEISIAPVFNTAIKYKSDTDFTPIGMVGATPMVFVAGPKAGVKTLDEALARSKREPNRLSFASSGVGTALHVSGELINLMAGTTFRHIPYRGAAQMSQDVLGGNVEFSVFVLTSALPHIESGKMTALGVTTATRSRAAPQIPPLGDHPRLKGYDMNVWFGLFGPARLPAPMTARLNKELNDLLRDQDVWQKLQKAGISNDGGTPLQLGAAMKAESVRVRSVVNQAVAGGVGS